MKRTIIKELRAWKTSELRKPLILHGARQVGKTYILRKFGQNDFPRYHYVNFENDERLSSVFEDGISPAKIINELQFLLDCSINTAEDLVIFDEIQQCPRALTALKYFREEMPELALCGAGSLIGVNLAPDSFPVGKVTILNLYPLSFDEFLAGVENTRLAELLRDEKFLTPLPRIAHDQLWDLWKTYLVIGGLPEMINIYRENIDNRYEAMKLARRVQSDLLDTYMADIAKHSGKTNALHIERLWRNVAMQLARTRDEGARKFRFKDAVPGMRGYERLSSPLDWLEKARLILRTSIVKRAETPLAGFARDNRFKQYFFDVGLLNAITNTPPAQILKFNYGSYKGYLTENFVAQELRAAGIRELFCWEGRTSEVEFLLETPSGIIPWEVKSGRIRQTKSLKTFEDHYHPELSIILSPGNVKIQGSRWQVPVYAAGRLGNLLIENTDSHGSLYGVR
ncbi:MAG: AAA family ATPase [Candidatus Auribacterota bacterium]|nr:AAA family ATPase [Candidatus Auribacterota bacterium]